MERFNLARGPVMILFLLLIGTRHGYCTEYVTVYTYHKMPPHIISFEEQQGIYFDYIEYFNRHQEGGYRFSLRYLPRKRLESYLRKGELHGLIIGVNPLWFQDEKEKKYLWTPVLFEDTDEFVSNAKNKLNYQGIKSLDGKKMCGVSGFYYRDINKLSDQGVLARLDADNEVTCLYKVINHLVDFTIASKYTLNYLIGKRAWHEQLYASEQPHDHFQRRLLVPKKLRKIYNYLTPLIEGMNGRQSQQIIEKYR